MLDKEEYIIQMADDMETIADLFYKYAIENSNINRMSSLLKENKNLYYDLRPISIPIQDDEKFPKRISHKNTTDLMLHFDMKVSGDYNKLISEHDPFENYQFNIVIKGKNKNNHQSKLVYALHFDRHDGTSPHLAHPLYHFQFGGERLKSEDIDHGQALFLDSPRIMHHPMEFFLGIDFVLSNFFPTVWNKMQKEPSYLQIVDRYQKSFLVPYFKTLINYCQNTPKPVISAYDIYPK